MNNRCGFSSNWPVSHTCYRETWKDYERCIWHADAREGDTKELETLQRTRESPQNRELNFTPDAQGISPAEILAEVKIAGVDLGDISLKGCILVHSDLSDTLFREADLSYSRLNFADLTDARIKRSNMEDIVAFGIDLSNSFITRSRMQNFSAGGGDFSKTQLGSVTLHSSWLHGVDFSDSYIEKCIFDGSNLEKANFTDADLFRSSLKRAYLHASKFIRTNLGDTDFRESLLAGMITSECTINMNTRFGRYVIYDPKCEGELKKVQSARVSDHVEEYTVEGSYSRYRDALESYRKLEVIYDTHSFFDRKRRAFFNRGRMKTALHKENHNYSRWIYSLLNRLILGYGDRPLRVIVTSILVILGFAISYPFVGGITELGQSDNIHAFFTPQDAIPAFPSTLETLLKSLYFSIVTFTTLGYGDYQPVGSIARGLAATESFIGASLMALLVFVLGRRATS